MSPISVLVAGAGLFGREHLTRLAGRAGVTVAGVADPRAEALDLARALSPQAAVFADARTMIEARPADALVVASPAASHIELAARALAAGMGVLLEKPVAPTSAEAAGLLAARGFVLPGHVLRFCADHRALVDCVRAGAIGEVLYVNSRRYRDDSHAWRYPDADPVLMTLIHDIDLALWVAAAPFATVSARRRGGPGFRSLTAITATTRSGIVCDLRTAWTFPGAAPPPDRLEILGAQGGVELTVGEGLRLWSGEERRDIPAAPHNDPLRAEQDHFLACVADRALKPALGLGEAIEGLRLAEAALASLERGREIALPLQPEAVASSR